MRDVLFIDEVSEADALMRPRPCRPAETHGRAPDVREIARELGSTSQQVYYHVKALEAAQLAEKVSEAQARGFKEASYQASARSYWLSPRLVRLGGGERAVREQTSRSFLLSLAEELHIEVGRLGGREGETPTLGLSAYIALVDPALRSAFMADCRRPSRSSRRSTAAPQAVKATGSSSPVIPATNPPQEISNDRPPEVRIDIAAPPAQVFHALTTSRDLEEWFAEHADVDVGSRPLRLLGPIHPRPPKSAAEASHKIIGHRPDEIVAFEWVVGDRSHTSPSRSADRNRHRQLRAPRCAPEARPGSQCPIPRFWCLCFKISAATSKTASSPWRPDFSHPSQRRNPSRTRHVRHHPRRYSTPSPSPAQLERWMGGRESPPSNPYPAEPTTSAGRKNGAVHSPSSILDTPNRLAYSWADPGPGGHHRHLGTRALGGATRITLVHSGFSARSN